MPDDDLLTSACARQSDNTGHDARVAKAHYYDKNKRLRMPNCSSTAMTCNIAGQRRSGGMTAVSDLPASHGLAGTAGSQRTIEERELPCCVTRGRRVPPSGEDWPGAAC